MWKRKIHIDFVVIVVVALLLCVRVCVCVKRHINRV